MPFRADGDAVGYEAAEDLAPSVEAEPDVDAASLFFFRVPLDYLAVCASHSIYGSRQTCDVNRAKPGVTAASKTPRLSPVSP